MTTLTETIRRVRKAVDDRPTAVQATLNIETVKTLLDAAERYENALKKLACLGNGDRYGNSIGNVIAQEALAPQTDTAAPPANSPAPCRMAEDGATRKDAPGAAVSPVCKVCGGWPQELVRIDEHGMPVWKDCPACNGTGEESK